MSASSSNAQEGWRSFGNTPDMLTAMAAANRIEAMDSARNLLDIFQAIDEEQNSGRYAPQQFKLKYVRAETVKTKLEEMLGVKKQATPMTPQQMQQMQQMRHSLTNM